MATAKDKAKPKAKPKAKATKPGAAKRAAGSTRRAPAAKGEPAEAESEIPAQDLGPQECMPCRGTGKVTSNLGGQSSLVGCPWCEGSGTRQAGIDAQSTWIQRQSEEDAVVAEPVGEAL
jgi:hypothetical protein